MSGNKTEAMSGGVDSFLDAIADPQRRDDAKAVRAMMERVSGEPAVMWGSSIVGFGHHHYKYESGREGDMARISFSPRAKELVLYGGFLRNESLLARLGKHKPGKGCLYIKRLADVDMAVFEAMTLEAWSWERGPGDVY